MNKISHLQGNNFNFYEKDNNNSSQSEFTRSYANPLKYAIITGLGALSLIPNMDKVNSVNQDLSNTFSASGEHLSFEPLSNSNNGVQIIDIKDLLEGANVDKDFAREKDLQNVEKNLEFKHVTTNEKIDKLEVTLNKKLESIENTLREIQENMITEKNLIKESDHIKTEVKNIFWTWFWKIMIGLGGILSIFEWVIPFITNLLNNG